jgi:hypothetical protein
MKRPYVQERSDIMIQTVTKSIFRDAFHKMGRGDQFSYEALGVLYDYLEDINESYELDVIEICCDWAELSREELFREYSVDEIETEIGSTILKVNEDAFLVTNF